MSEPKKIYKKVKKNTEELDIRQNIELNVLSEDAYDKSEDIIEKNFRGLQVFSIGDIPTIRNPKLNDKYAGGFINSENGIITIGVCVENRFNFRYVKNERIALAYVRSKQLYLTTAQIVGIKEIQENDIQEINSAGNPERIKEHINNFLHMLDEYKFIVLNLCILTEPEEHQRRSHVRIEVDWNIYFKLAKKSKELSEMAQMWIDEKKFDTHEDYFSMKTVDISAGGFMSVIKTAIPKGTVLDAIIDIKGDKINVGVEVVNCIANKDNPERFNIHARFTNITKAASDKLISYILNPEQNV